MADAPSESPGAVAPDGSPVDVYRRLPAGPGPEMIHGAIPAGCDILELGCGTGRMTRALLSLGHRVTAVDNSAEMLAELEGVAGVERLEADLLDLDVGRRFPAVVLASHFINTPAPQGDAFVEVAARHTTDDGFVIIEAYPTGMDWTAAVGRRSEVGPVSITVRSATVDGDAVSAVVVYGVDARSWEQAFDARMLDESGLRTVVEGAGLRFDRWLDEASGWFAARPAGD